MPAVTVAINMPLGKGRSSVSRTWVLGIVLDCGLDMHWSNADMMAVMRSMLAAPELASPSDVCDRRGSEGMQRIGSTDSVGGVLGEWKVAPFCSVMLAVTRAGKASWLFEELGGPLDICRRRG